MHKCVRTYWEFQVVNGRTPHELLVTVVERNSVVSDSNGSIQRQIKPHTDLSARSQHVLGAVFRSVDRPTHKSGLSFWLASITSDIHRAGDHVRFIGTHRLIRRAGLMNLSIF